MCNSPKPTFDKNGILVDCDCHEHFDDQADSCKKDDSARGVTADNAI